MKQSLSSLNYGYSRFAGLLFARGGFAEWRRSPQSRCSMSFVFNGISASQIFPRNHDVVIFLKRCVGVLSFEETD